MAILLFAHIGLALISFLTVLRVIMAAHAKEQERADRRVVVMWVSTVTTVVSGVPLFIITGSIGRSCLSMAVFLVLTLLAYRYKKYAFAS